MKIMKKARITVAGRSKTGGTAEYLFAFGSAIGILCALLLLLAGCSQPGETAAEGHRRHLRNLSIDRQQIMQDVDKTLLTDQPSKLTERRIR